MVTILSNVINGLYNIILLCNHYIYIYIVVVVVVVVYIYIKGVYKA